MMEHFVVLHALFYFYSFALISANHKLRPALHPALTKFDIYLNIIWQITLSTTVRLN